jgi:glycerol-1-phosphate dehydrogenase [NAD(P)+]
VIEADILRRASAPNMECGRGLLPTRIAALTGSWALISQPELRMLLDDRLVARAAAVYDVDSLALADVERMSQGLPASVETVVGFGGGMALDAAKWAAWRRGATLILAPSIVSVDAVVTNTIAVRRGGGITYEGFVVADRIVLDPEIVTRAPERLNRAGVGDLLSIHTGLDDWRRGAGAGTIAFDDGIAAAAAAVLDRVEALGPEIGAVSDAGLEGVLRAYADVNALCLRVGHSGPEEGSEHYFAYHLEHLTGRSFVHGELIALGTMLMATLQRNAPLRPRRILEACRVRWRPDAIGVDRSVVRETLLGLRDFVRDQRLPHSIIDEADLAPAATDALIASVLGIEDSGSEPDTRPNAAPIRGS